MPLNKTQQRDYNAFTYNKLGAEDEKRRDEFFRMAKAIW